MPNDKALIEYPGLFFSSLDMDERYPCGESPAEFYSRIKLWFDRFTGKSAEDVGNVLVITHGGVINVIYHIVKRLEWSNKTPPFKAANCSIHILNLEKMTFTAENLTDHLKA